MQSTAPHQALHSYPLIITHTHSLTSLKCLSKMSLRDSLHANYGSSSFSVPFMPSLSLSLFSNLASVSSFIYALYYLPLCVSPSAFFLSERLFLSFVLSLHFTLLLSSFPQVLLEHTVSDKSIACVHIKHTEYKTGLGHWTNTSRICNRLNSLLLEMSLLLFANLNKLYLL